LALRNPSARTAHRRRHHR